MTAGLPTKAGEVLGGESFSMNHSPEYVPASINDLDLEWARLIVFAKELGFSYHEIAGFLHTSASNATPEDE